MKATRPSEELGLGRNRSGIEPLREFHKRQTPAKMTLHPSTPGGPVSSLRSHNPKEGKGAALPFVMVLMSRLEMDPTSQMF